MKRTLITLVVAMLLFGCTPTEDTTGDAEMNAMKALVSKYAQVEFPMTVEGLSETEQQIIDKLIAASKIIDTLYWKQASKDGLELREKLAASDAPVDKLKLHFLEINKFGYDRLDGNAPFLDNAPLPEGATFWPEDLTREELAAYVEAHPEEKEALYGLTTVVKRDGEKLVAVPYRELFNEELAAASQLLKEAAELAENESLKRYLNLRATALVTDDYFESDMAWMDLEGNTIDIVIGAIEVYEDGLMNLKAAYEAYVLVKDQKASEELESYINAMESMQQSLPIGDAFKQRKVKLGSSVGVFTQVYTSGQCEAGSKTIAISLPNDPRVRAEKGARKVMLRNAIDAKFEKILIPIAERLLDPEQLNLVQGNSFFSNVLLHEVSHSLGNDYVLDENGNETEVTIDEALKDKSTAIEECKADIGGLYAADTLVTSGVMSVEERQQAYVTFTAGIFRSVRFGAASAHGIANAIAINWLRERGAVRFMDDEEGRWQVALENFHLGIETLLEEVLTIQYTGDYERAVKLVDNYGTLPPELVEKLESLTDVPVDIEILYK